jgi:hypothetical protein
MFLKLLYLVMYSADVIEKESISGRIVSMIWTFLFWLRWTKMLKLNISIAESRIRCNRIGNQMPSVRNQMPSVRNQKSDAIGSEFASDWIGIYIYIIIWIRIHMWNQNFEISNRSMAIRELHRRLENSVGDLRARFHWLSVTAWIRMWKKGTFMPA